MIPEIGQFSLILALVLSGLGVVLPSVGLWKQRDPWMQVARPMILGQSFFMTLAFVILVVAFVENDFSVRYVATHSNSTLPLLYRISATWAGHEGSFLIWILLLNFWLSWLCVRSRALPLEFSTRVLVVLEVFTFFFLLFLLSTSNPFARLLPNFPVDGNDLNPLLQDPGLVVHPPLLYMGYVGLSIPFAFAVATLWGKHFDLPWAKWVRPWVLGAFAFLTLGITLGSYWAYYELGWGGWWFWDPVENASFIPWLLSIALIHSCMATDKRGLFVGWSLFLCLVVFATSLIGTFLIRSGVLASVHMFASDPERGVFLLAFIAVYIGGALSLYAARAKWLFSDKKIALCSRETLILLGTLLLFASALSVLFGTVFPLIYEALTAKKISVGFPYFNAVFIPMILPVLVLVPLGPLLRWGDNPLPEISRKVRVSLVISVLFSFWAVWFFPKNFSLTVALLLALGCWIALGTWKFIRNKLKRGGPFWGVSLGSVAMFFSHLGVAVCLVGIVLVTHYQIERDVYMEPGQSLSLADYTILFDRVSVVEGSNYVGYQGHFVVSQEGEHSIDLFPEKRIYVVQRIKMTETAIDPGLFRDIYISLGETLKNGGWSLRVYYKPFVRWIWLGTLMMALGGFLGMFARRKKVR